MKEELSDFLKTAYKYNKIKDLREAIVNGVILHDNFLREDGVNLNTDMRCDGNKLISRILAASNLLAVKYKGEGFNNKFIVIMCSYTPQKWRFHEKSRDLQ